MSLPSQSTPTNLLMLSQSTEESNESAHLCCLLAPQLSSRILKDAATHPVGEVGQLLFTCG